MGCGSPGCIIPPVISDPPLTKRQLGLLIILAGASPAAITLAANGVGLGHFSGFGPAKQLALVGAGAIALFGLSLLPLGQRPA
jgi:hypothetical protein